MMAGIMQLLTGWRGYAAAALTGGLVLGVAVDVVQGWRHGEQIASLERDHAQQVAQYSQDAERAQAAARATEQARQTAIEEIRNETDQEIAAAVVRERAAADARVRGTAAEYAARYRAAASRASATAERQAADTAVGMFAELLSQSDDLAGVYAAAADRARIAGLACERAYDAVRAAAP